MSEGLIELEIVSPEKQLFNGCVDQVSLPGAKAPFTVLHNHAPMVSTLCAGDIKWKTGNDEHLLVVKSGFVEVKENKVTACVELKVKSENRG